MKKFTLLTFSRLKAKLLKELQKFEDVHFKNLEKDELEAELEKELAFLRRDASEEAESRCEAELFKVNFALARTEPYSTAPKGIKALTTPPRSLGFDEFDAYHEQYDYNAVYERLKAADEAITQARTEISRLRGENDNLRPWLKLDVSPEEFDKGKYTKSVVGTVNRLAWDAFKAGTEESFKEAYLEALGYIKEDAAVLLTVPSEQYDDILAHVKTLGFSRLSLGFKGLPSKLAEANNARIRELEAELEKAQNSMKDLGPEHVNLQIVYDYYETALAREQACRNFLATRDVFMAEGWVPEEEAERFKAIVEGVCGKEYYLAEEEVARDSEDVPIKLKNSKMVSAFEDITMMFSTPKYNEIDPTPLLMPFYMVFFGLMVGDLGYGAILCIATACALKFMHFKPSMRRFLLFFFCCSFTTMLGGVIYGGAFGVTFITPIPTANLADFPSGWKPIMDTQKDVMVMMIVTMALGIIQILFGVAVKGYALLKEGKIFAAVCDSLLWILVLLSGIGMFAMVLPGLPGFLKTLIPAVFVICLVGLALTQGREYPTIVGKVGGGLYGVYGLTGYVGDIISYTRIAALALSGAYIAMSFNIMAGMFPVSVRWLLGTIVFLFGQVLNMGLGFLGAYVHSCRLQYVEYFGKFFEGGGVTFTPLTLKNKYINITK
ncbi:MAG: V-type ATP synthase subunit I [Clostridiales bacterium]|nr:V-type ATP synthase subunit I [Clostridiales bacterium]